MTIEAGVAILSLLITVGGFVLGLFVSSRISASEERLREWIETRYLPREVAAATFHLRDSRIDDLIRSSTPRYPFPTQEDP